MINNEIINKIKDKKVVLFGETHGTKEIPELLSGLFKEISKNESFNLCLEIPDEFQKQLDLYMKSGEYKILENIQFFSIKYCKDGRNSLEYINLIRSIYKINNEYKKNINILFISPSSAKNQEEVEKNIANRILKIAKDKKTFAVMGDIHASKKEINFPQIRIIPAGELIHKKLNDKMCSIVFIPKSGNFFNNGLKKVEYTDKDKFERNFDYFIKLKKVSPCSFLKLSI